MSNQSLVSIIIPTRNRRDLLEYALRSVLQQTYEHLQIVIQDNNSQDGTKEFLLEMCEADKRIEYHRAEHDLTMTENWNTALNHVRGDYFMRLDDDNVIMPTLVETLLNEISRLSLEMINSSEINVGLNRTSYTLFEDVDETHVLNKYALLFLNYFALLDSNYSIYSVSLVRSIFPDGRNIYTTSLPDRFLDYMICDVMDRKKVKVAFNTGVRAVTRFDYKAGTPKGFTLKYVDYNNADLDFLSSQDCHNNFSMHRIATIRKFLNENRDSGLKKYFNKKITAPELDRTLMKMGHIYMARYCYNFNELLIYNRYVSEIVYDFVRNYGKKCEGRSSLLNIIAVIRNSFISNIHSLVYIWQGKKRDEASINLTYGNEICKMAVQGESLTEFVQYTEKGRYKDLSRKMELGSR